MAVNMGYWEQVREEVVAVQRRLERGLDALAGAALGNTKFTADHLEDFLGLVLPLLGSPLVGEGAAFEAVHALAQCLPGNLGKHGLAIARALRLVELDKHGAEHICNLMVCFLCAVVGQGAYINFTYHPPVPI